MADALTIGTAISVTGSARQVLGVSRVGGNRIGSVQLDNRLSPDPFASVRLILSSNDAKTALSIAILSGNGIIGALKAIKSSAELAGRGSLVSNLTNLTIGGTRVSRLNLHSDTLRAISLIDGLVQQSEFKNANFISSSSPNIQINTTRFGGTFNVLPQPLDSTGLNLAGISLLSGLGADDAVARIQAAIIAATQRVDALESLQRAITNRDFSAQILSSLVTSQNGSGLPLGTLVNIVG